ncbi:MAG: LysM peptidoglycan-binding domain-containing protein, partial [Bacteroidales bacterium]|nr:LysM peptidoglycan-binding domain-containing protein [Bacteroidales bacterium]
MKKTLTFAIAALLCLFALSVESPAQDYVATPVTVSKDKVKQNGKLYYAHIVLEKQTLFSIAKAYGVTVDEIYDANAGLRENGLKTNSIILIPAESGSAGAASDDSSASEEKQPDSAQTSGAAQDSETAQSEVSGSSSETAASSETGTSGKSKKSSAKASKNRQDYFIHTVKWYEDIDMISSKYGVSTEIIMRANGLTSKKLKAKQQLKIPTNPEAYEVTGELPGSETASTAGADWTTGSTSSQTSAEPSETQEVSSSESGQSSWSSGQSAWGGAADESQSSSFSGSFPTFRNMNKVNAMLMLPFNASGNPNEVSMDFYSGALLAAKNLADEGLELNLGVYDTYGDVIPVTMDNVSSTDFIIGLLSTNGFSSLLGSVPTGTLVVSPLDARTESLTESNGNFIQCSNSTTAQYEDLAHWIGEDMQPGDSVVVIYENTLA